MLIRVLFWFEKFEKVFWYVFNKKNKFYLFWWFCFDLIVFIFWLFWWFGFGCFVCLWNFIGVIKDWIKKDWVGIGFVVEYRGLDYLV